MSNVLFCLVRCINIYVHLKHLKHKEFLIICVSLQSSVVFVSSCQLVELILVAKCCMCLVHQQLNLVEEMTENV